MKIVSAAPPKASAGNWRKESDEQPAFEGTLQDVYGQAKDTAAEAAEAIRDAGNEAGDFLRTAIEERPYTTAAIALGIGFLIGRFGRRGDY